MRRCLQKLGSLAGMRCGCHPAVLTQKEEVSPGSPLFLEQALSGRSLRGRPSSFHEPSYREKNGNPRFRFPKGCVHTAVLPLQLPGSLILSRSVQLSLHPIPLTDIVTCIGAPKPKAMKKACGIPHRPFNVLRLCGFPAIVRTPFPGRLPGSRPYRRLAAPAGTRPARLPGTGPSAGCSCCPGPPAGGCRRH